MKNTLIAILVFGILIIGYLFIKEKTKPVDYGNVWPETKSVTTTSNNSAPQTNSDVNSLTTYKTFAKDGYITFGIPNDFSAQQFDGGERSVVMVKDGSGNFQFSILKTKDCDYDVELGTSPVGCFTNEQFIKNFGNRYTPEQQLAKSGEVYAPFPKFVSETNTEINFSGETKKVIKQTTTLDGTTEYYYYVEGVPFILIKTNSNIQEKTLESINFSPTVQDLSEALTVR